MASNRLSLLMKSRSTSKLLQISSLVKPNQHTGIRWYPSGGTGIGQPPRWVYPMTAEINRRIEAVAEDQRLRTGKEERPRRSEFIEWNYNTELTAFQARLGEAFDEALLRKAFISPCFVDHQRQMNQDLMGDDLLAPKFETNEDLAVEGRNVIENTLKTYLRTALPHLPEEGVEAITKFLTREELLAHVSFHIGTLDLVQSVDYPPSVQTMSQTFEALIGALAASEDSQSKASKLVLDLVATQLHGQDLTDVWDIADPMETLASILDKSNRGPPEARLLWSSGKETLLACYHVGIYSDRELIGQAPGESATIAEEMAARDALRKLFGFDDAAKPLPYGKELHKMKPKTTPNPTLDEWKTHNISVV